MNEKVKTLIFYILPHHFISWISYFLAHITWPPIKDRFIDLYRYLHPISLDDAVIKDPYEFKSLNDFFTRALDPSARPLARGKNTLVCPVDGRVSQAQAIKNGRIFQAKGQDYSLLELVGGIKELAEPFENGMFSTIYLSPTDYHRIHMPLAGELTDTVYVPGRLFSVAPWTVANVPRLFARNERVVCKFNTPAGPMIMILVGAINVSAIDTVWGGCETPPSGWTIKHRTYEDVQIKLKKGAEMGRFNLGSTVILLMGDNVKFDDSITPGEATKMGQALGSFE
ncbi:MAG: phosphatidylserine decarboxylase [Gammaproteobacteria bacterium]|nr:phosphatidylserine decarboxylase [Gammaproteobacteria bacterium]